MTPLHFLESSSHVLTAGRMEKSFGAVKVLTAPLSACQMDFMSKKVACQAPATSSFAISATRLIRLER